MTSAVRTASPLTFLDATTAGRIDEKLMNEGLYDVRQLMELAGLGVAEVVEHAFPTRCKVAIACGPGNNGGDGLVAARHLRTFGYDVSVCLYKPPSKDYLKNLVNLLELFDIPVSSSNDSIANADVVVDALFGFGSKGAPREPYDEALKAIAAAKAPVVAVDVPSGWDVDFEDDKDRTGGNPSEPKVFEGAPVLKPAVLVSLMAPKKCARQFEGKHFVAGRFLPPSMVKEFDLKLAPFAGSRSYCAV